HAPQLGLLDLEIFSQHSPDHGKGDLDTGTGIWCAAYDLELLAAVTHTTDAQLICVRMLFGGENLTYHDATEFTGSRSNAIHFEASHGQTCNQIITRNLGVHPAAQPLFTEFHVLFLLSK